MSFGRVNPNLLAKSQSIVIIGGGLASLYLAFRLSNQNQTKIQVIDSGEQRPDHLWGFWDKGETYLRQTVPYSLREYKSAQIKFCDSSQKICFGQYVYRVVSSSAYEEFLRGQALSNGVNIIEDSVVCTSSASGKFLIECQKRGRLSADLLFDSRSQQTPDGAMLQHFVGKKISFDKEVFNPKVATLMDFSVDQSEGLHFIYCLPFSPTEALLESTVFSTTLLAESWYEGQIESYIRDNLKLDKFQVNSIEQGCIPLFNGAIHDSNGIPIGLRAGARRASTGYAFSQIHRQIDELMGQWENGKSLKTRPGCDFIERRMDEVLLKVLNDNKGLGPSIFMNMVKSLSGNEFAEFMCGYSSYTTRARLVSSLPKQPFLRASLERLLSWV